jgi:hypothetical protein
MNGFNPFIDRLSIYCGKGFVIKTDLNGILALFCHVIPSAML